MIKFAGALLVLLAGTMIGFLQAARFAARPRQIRELLHALQRLETEVGYGQTPLPEALAGIGKSMTGPLAALFSEIASRLSAESAESGETVKQIWEKSISERWAATAMRKTEMAALLRLGATLGGSGKDDQLKHIRLAAIQLQAEEGAAREDQRRYEKLSRSLGMLGAALVVIVML
ncbi:stage III sporulation protein SpoIIIAB [Cohnella soli]|uniref:Stage III sporulation protein SpoIIIAB n=1 Tax=Cohnella soli TaxID=425005 RepID=A0ABW0HS69_9BACL